VSRSRSQNRFAAMFARILQHRWSERMKSTAKIKWRIWSISMSSNRHCTPVTSTLDVGKYYLSANISGIHLIVFVLTYIIYWPGFTEGKVFEQPNSTILHTPLMCRTAKAYLRAAVAVQCRTIILVIVNLF
jgi:hypothetical protein